MANVKTLNSYRNFFNPHNSTSPASDSISSANSSETQSHNNISVSMTRPQSTQNQSSILLSYNNKAKREAEIVWTLFCVRHGFSNNI